MKNKILFLAFCFLITTSQLFGGNNEVKRQITRQFKVNKNAELSVTNKYGNITINTWDRNEIDFSVEITGQGNTEKIAQQMADRVAINFNQTGNKVSVETVFEQQRNLNCNNCGTTVNYTVNIPASAILNLNNKYGNIQLDETSQPFTAEVKYGNISANRLTGSMNTITLKYGNIELNETDKMILEMKYSNARINRIGELKMECAYSKLHSQEIDRADIQSKYDKFTIDRINNFRITSGYSDLTVGTLSESFDAASLRYCKVKIDNIASDFSFINISANYTPIHLGVGTKLNARLELSTSYGNIKTNGITFSHASVPEEDRYTKSINGIIGKEENPKASIKIRDTYSDIILEK